MAKDYISQKEKNVLHIWEPALQVNIYYINTDKFKTFQRIIKRQFKLDIEKDGDPDQTAGEFRVFGCKIEKSTKVSEVGVIWCSKKKPDDVVHEIRHAIDWVVKNWGLECGETAAYLEGFLFRKIYGLKD